jgi:hypothetical protein
LVGRDAIKTRCRAQWHGAARPGELAGRLQVVRHGRELVVWIIQLNVFG